MWRTAAGFKMRIVRGQSETQLKISETVLHQILAAARIAYFDRGSEYAESL